MQLSRSSNPLNDIGAEQSSDLATKEGCVGHLARLLADPRLLSDQRNLHDGPVGAQMVKHLAMHPKTVIMEDAWNVQYGCAVMLV